MVLDSGKDGKGTEKDVKIRKRTGKGRKRDEECVGEERVYGWVKGGWVTGG